MNKRGNCIYRLVCPVYKDSASADLDVEVVHVPRPSRVFEPRFCIAAWKGSIPPAFANEYGYGMASRIAQWWTARTSAGTEEIKWVSFVHLYVDYQLTWGCAGPLQSKKTWLDIFLRPYLDAGKYPFLKKSNGSDVASSSFGAKASKSSAWSNADVPVKSYRRISSRRR